MCVLSGPRIKLHDVAPMDGEITSAQVPRPIHGPHEVLPKTSKNLIPSDVFSHFVGSCFVPSLFHESSVSSGLKRSLNDAGCERSPKLEGPVRPAGEERVFGTSRCNGQAQDELEDQRIVAQRPERSAALPSRFSACFEAGASEIVFHIPKMELQ